MSILTRPVANSGTGEATASTTNRALHHRWANSQSRRGRYRPWIRAKYDPSRSAGGGGKRAASVGMMVWATYSETTIATPIGTATCTMIIEISLSSLNIIDRKTLTVE